MSKMSKFKAKDVVKSLVDNKYYVVSSAGLKEADRIEENGEIRFSETGTTITLSDEVVSELFVIEKEAPLEAPAEGEFEARGGKLYRNGEKIPSGLKILEILARVPGGVYLRVASLKKDKVDLFCYRTEEDLFDKKVAEAAALSVEFQSEGIVGIKALFRNDVSLKPEKEGDEPEKDVSVKDVILLYNGLYGVFDEVLPYGSHIEAISPGRKDKDFNVLFVTDKAVKAVVTTDGEDIFVPDPEKDGTETVTMRLEVKHMEDYVDVNADIVRFKGRYKQVVPCNDGNFVFMTKNGVIHTNYGHGMRCAFGDDVVEVLERYRVPVRLQVENQANCTFVFMDKDYNVCKINVRKTRDRGFVTTIEELTA